MKSALNDAELVRKYSPRMGGVFSIKDLRTLFEKESKVSLHRRITVLGKAGILTRFCRGMYVTSGFNPEILAARIIEESYLSLGTVLAKEMMIGSIPKKTIYAAKIGKSRIFKGPGLTVEYVGVTESLFFGYTAKHGLRYATPEKALLDTLYFHLHGKEYSFNIFQDIDISRINRDRVMELLKKYRNPRFVSFVKGYLDDRH